MRFGTAVLVRRGGGALPGTPGCTRVVKGTLIGRHGHECLVRLTQDDPLDTIGINKAGQVYRWGSSAVSPDPSP